MLKAMRFAPPSFKFIYAESAMYYPRFNARGRRPWRRGFCDRPPPDDRGGAAFVSGDSHPRSVRDANYGFQQGYTGDAWIPQGPPPQHFHPPPPHFRPPPPPHYRPRPPSRPADFRDWNYSLSQPPPQCERFIVLSYNILADYLARDHRSKLYFHIPHHILDWGWRKRRLLIEFGLWDPDIMCLQEVDRFHDLEEELAVRGYAGIWKMRTGNAVDGCATFWRTNRFHLRHEEHIEFSKLGLRDNVAQICVLESRIQNPVGNASASLAASYGQSRGVNQVVICNIHVLYNPRRGEIKLGQVRVLLDHAYAVSRVWNDAPVIVCGDFNSTPKSPLYNFISGQELSLSGLARDQVSGQYSANMYAPRAYVGSGFYSGQPSVGNSNEVAVGTKQGSCCLGSHNQYKPQNNIQNPILTEKLSNPHRSNGMLDISLRSSSDNPYIIQNDTVYVRNAKEEGESGIVDGRCSESSSTQCRFVDQSKGTVESCSEQSEIPMFDVNKQTSIVSCLGDLCFERGQQEHGEKCCDGEFNHSNRITPNEHGSQSNPNIFSESINNPYLGSSSQNLESSQKFMDHLGEGWNSSKLFMEFPSDRKHKENINWKNSFRGSTEGFSSNMASKEAVVAEAALDKLVDDAVTEISSGKIVSGTFPAQVEKSTVQASGNISADLTTEQKCDLVISSKITCVSNLSDISDCSTSLSYSSLNEVRKIVMEDASSDVDRATINLSSGILPCIKGNTSSSDINYFSKGMEPNSEEYSQSPEKSASSGELLNNLLEDPDSVSHGVCAINGLCSPEEDTDPNFLKELLGTEDPCEYREEIVTMTSSDQIQSSSISMHEAQSSDSYLSSVEFREGSSPHIGPYSTDLEKCYYNPSLWTPMEIETASGSAECTFIKHNLKLRSTYADVEDYTGTKDSGREPEVTSYNRQFMGTVDYIWCSEGLQTVKVLDTIPKHVLRWTPGFPTQKWGSDHIALVCQLAFTKDLRTK